MCVRAQCNTTHIHIYVECVFATTHRHQCCTCMCIHTSIHITLWFIGRKISWHHEFIKGICHLISVTHATPYRYDGHSIPRPWSEAMPLESIYIRPWRRSTLLAWAFKTCLLLNRTLPPGDSPGTLSAHWRPAGYHRCFWYFESQAVTVLCWRSRIIS